MLLSAEFVETKVISPITRLAFQLDPRHIRLHVVMGVLCFEYHPPLVVHERLVGHGVDVLEAQASDGLVRVEARAHAAHHRQTLGARQLPEKKMNTRVVDEARADVV